jgi:hypothetical protein
MCVDCGLNNEKGKYFNLIFGSQCLKSIFLCQQFQFLFEVSFLHTDSIRVVGQAPIRILICECSHSRRKKV